MNYTILKAGISQSMAAYEGYGNVYDYRTFHFEVTEAAPESFIDGYDTMSNDEREAAIKKTLEYGRKAFAEIYRDDLEELTHDDLLPIDYYRIMGDGNAHAERLAHHAANQLTEVDAVTADDIWNGAADIETTGVIYVLDKDEDELEYIVHLSSGEMDLMAYFINIQDAQAWATEMVAEYTADCEKTTLHLHRRYG